MATQSSQVYCKRRVEFGNNEILMLMGLEEEERSDMQPYSVGRCISSASQRGKPLGELILGNGRTRGIGIPIRRLRRRYSTGCRLAKYVGECREKGNPPARRVTPERSPPMDVKKGGGG